MNKQSIGLNRVGNDKFYTKKEIAQKCIDFTKKFISYKNSDIIIEPSAGNGSFIEPIISLKTKTIFIDITPEHKDIKKMDYLKDDINSCIENSDFGNINVIGNPPFGRQSSLTIKFLKKSCSFANSISFILPKSFKKDSMKKYIDLHFHLEGEMDIPKNSFLVNDIEYDVPCIFQVWIKKDFKREVIEKKIPIGYTFVKRNESPDISFRRVGVNAGIIDTKNVDTKSEQSHYFIRFENRDLIEQSIEIFRNAKFDTDNTVGPKSISKQEIINTISINF